MYTDPASGLEIRCVAVEYQDFPTVEWTLYFKNTGSTDTSILEKTQALDIGFTGSADGEFLLHHNIGSPANGNDYGLLETPLERNATRLLGGKGGRPTNADWSYFNLEWSGEGLIVAVGWPGQWAAQLARDNARGLHLQAGQELTHFKLSPGEQVRSPLIVLQFWKGLITAQNVWRRWMMAHSMPRPGGRLPPPQLLASSSRQYDEMIKANESNQIMFIDRYLEEGIKLDYWWMDAGWYVHHGGGWPRVGTWEVDTARFPKGLRAISDYAHSRDLKILVWFEPERVTAGTWLADNHPEWVLGGAKGGLLNLGNEDARRWLTEHTDQLLNEQGIDLYRQDFNMDPLNHWRGADAPDRQGITEIKHVTGYLAYWDELRRRIRTCSLIRAPAAAVATTSRRCAVCAAVAKRLCLRGDRPPVHDVRPVPMAAVSRHRHGRDAERPVLWQRQDGRRAVRPVEQRRPELGLRHRHSRARPRLRGVASVHRAMAAGQRELLRRFLPADAVDAR
jgi:alpha-galactosidase